jgi:membrane protein DedA with SNARE-associated domain
MQVSPDPVTAIAAAPAPIIDRLLAGLSEMQIYTLVVGLLLQGIIVAIAPEEVVIMSLGVLWSQNRVHFFPSIAAIATGLLTANLIIVWVAGRFSHLAIFQKKSVHAALEKFKARGKWIVFITRFTPFIRGPVYYAAGISGMRVRDFFQIDAAAFCVQCPLVFMIGATIGLHTGSITDAYRIIAISALSVAALILLGSFGKTWLAPKLKASAWKEGF